MLLSPSDKSITSTTGIPAVKTPVSNEVRRSTELAAGAHAPVARNPRYYGRSPISRTVCFRASVLAALITARSRSPRARCEFAPQSTTSRQSGPANHHVPAVDARHPDVRTWIFHVGLSLVATISTGMALESSLAGKNPQVAKNSGTLLQEISSQ